MEFKDESKVLFCKLHPDAIIPSKRVEDSGYDVYALFDEDYVVIKPHETKILHTGLASVFSDRYGMFLHERGSTGTKGISQRCGVIDSGYRSEWMIPITNLNEVPLVIAKAHVTKDQIKRLTGYYEFIVYPYTKAICQAVLQEIPRTEIEEINHEQLMSYKSERGEGKLGSSGK